jgi:hypothetical protein
MRVLVAGPYPPTPDPVGDVVLEHVRLLRRGGDAVTVVSPKPSAAHMTADLTTPRGSAELARLARGANLLVVHYTSDLAVASGPRVLRTAAGVALRRALKSVDRIEVVIHRVDQHDDGAVLELLRGSSAHFAVPDVAVLARLDAQGIRLPTVRVDETFALAPSPPGRHEQWPDGHPAVQAVVRSRAATARADFHHAALDRLRASMPLRLSAPTSRRPGLTTVRRVLRRLTAWEMDPLVSQMNRIRAAVLDQLDSDGERLSPADQAEAPAGGAPSSSGKAARTAFDSDDASTGQS